MKTILTPEFINSKKFKDLLLAEPKFLNKPLTNGQYYSTIHPKRGVMWHHTAGLNASGAWAWWNQTPERVGTPFIIDRDGTIWVCFDPKFWAYHLGVKGDDDSLEKQTVSIELVSGGALYGPKSDTFYPLYPKLIKPTIINPDDIYTPQEPINGESFRGIKSYHAYSDAQVIASCQLLVWLKAKFPTIVIPNELGKFWIYNPEVITKSLPGIHSHSTVRKDKNDIFPQENFIQALQVTCSYLSKKK